MKYLNISNKIYLHTNDDLHANDDLMLHINDKTKDNTCIDNELHYDISINSAINNELIQHIDLGEFEHSTENIYVNNSKEYNVSAKEVLINKFFNKLNMLININMQKSINWCKKHNFIVNKEFLCD